MANGGAAAAVAAPPAPALAERAEPAPIDPDETERAIRNLLVALGRDIGEPGLRETVGDDVRIVGPATRRA